MTQKVDIGDSWKVRDGTSFWKKNYDDFEILNCSVKIYTHSEKFEPEKNTNNFKFF